MRSNHVRRAGLIAALMASATGCAGTLADRVRERRAVRRDDDELDEPADAGNGSFALPPGVTVQRDLAYGPAPEHRLDVYRSAAAPSGPVLFMVHGGGWRHGDKTSARAVANKVLHWCAKGWIVVSTNYRLLPKAVPLEQADDVARALAFVAQNAARWGARADRLVIMGHSAGAHLVSLLASDSSPVAAHGGPREWTATVSLDSAAFNVVGIMSQRHLPLYDKAFGSDRDTWTRSSPLHRLLRRPASPMLIVCSSRRSDSCPQGQDFAAKARQFGAQVTVLPVNASHGEINERTGSSGPVTAGIEDFFRGLGLS